MIEFCGGDEGEGGGLSLQGPAIAEGDESLSSWDARGMTRARSCGCNFSPFKPMPAQFRPDGFPFKGMPDRRCEIDYWGYVLQGSFSHHRHGWDGTSVPPSAGQTTCDRGISSGLSSGSR
jgi:hypothetical protein